MAYRNNSQYRSWNALALGLKTEGPEEPNKMDDLLSKDRQRPRRESWSQPPQRGRGTLRGRGTWYIDNRLQRPQNRRRYTMPDPQDYSYHANDEPSDFNQLEDNSIIEEPRNLSVSPESDYNDSKTKESDGEKCDYQDEPPSWELKQSYSANNVYRPPRSRSASWHWKSNSSSDDGSQSQGYSNGSSKKYEPENYKAQRKNSWEREPEPDQTWVHDKFEYTDSDSDQKYKKNKKDASTQVTPIDINNELRKNNSKKITACEFSKKINKPESPKDQANPAELPKEITIKFSELMKESNDEKPESIIPQTLDSKNEVIEPEVASEAKSEEVLPEVTPEVVTPEIVTPEVLPEVTPEVVTSEITPEVIPEAIPEAEVTKATPEVIPETEVISDVTPEVTPKAEVTPEVTPAVTSETEVTPKAISEVTPEAEVTPKVTSEVTPEAEVTPKVTSEVTPEAEVNPEVIPASPKEEELQIQILINLDEDNNSGVQPIQPKISEDIYAVDWVSYQKSLMEEEIRRTMERPTKMSTPRKLDTGLKDFDSLI